MSALVETIDLVKSYGPVPALAGVNFKLEPGTIHALLGENGAGKSTLVKALTGVHRPDSGKILLRGREVDFKNPLEASRAGIGVVHQERNIVPGFTVAENICLHDQPTRGGFIDWEAQTEVAKRALDRLGVVIDTGAITSECSVAQIQLIEIAKALAFKSDVLILDEPTSSLTERETHQLFDVLRGLRDSGAAITLVTHKLEEVFQICDAVTILRDGHGVVEAQPLNNYTQREIVNLMVGRSLAQRDVRIRDIDRSGTPMLTLEGVDTELGHENINLEVSKGEILGLYGLVGAGRSELARSVIGLHRITKGTVRLDGNEVHIGSVQDAVHRYRVGYMTEDRKGDGLFMELSIRRNIAVTLWRKFSSLWGVNERSEAKVANEYIRSLGIRTTNDLTLVGELSGGNQQKVSVAKWLAPGLEVLFIDEPTVGVDVRTKEEIHNLILDLADGGLTVVLISSDLPEMVTLADRIGVMDDYQLLEVVQNSKDYPSMSKQVMGIIHATSHGHTVAEVEEAESGARESDHATS